MKMNFIFVSLLILCAASGCACDSDFVPKEYSADAEDVRAVVLNVRDRDISISPSLDGLIHIEYFSSAKEGYEINISDAGELMMKAVSNKNWLDFIGLKPSASKRVISMWIPSSILDSLEIENTNGDIKADDLAFLKDVALSLNNGNILFENLDIGSSLMLYVKNGNIEGTLVGGYDDFAIGYDIKKGSHNLVSKKWGDKNLHVTVNNGNANIGFVPE